MRGLLATVAGCCFFTWMVFFTSSSSLFSASDTPVQSFEMSVVIFSILCAAARLACSASSRVLTPLLDSRKAIAIASAVAAASVPCIACAPYLPVNALAGMVYAIGIVGAVLFGAVFLIVAWIHSLLQHDDASRMLIASGSFALAPPMFYLFDALPFPLIVGFAMLMPIVFGVSMTAMAQLDAQAAQAPPDGKHTPDNALFANATPNNTTPRQLTHRRALSLLPIGVFFCGLIGQVVRAANWTHVTNVESSAFALYHEIGVFIGAACVFAYTMHRILRNNPSANQALAIGAFVVMALGIVVPGLFDEAPSMIADIAMGFGLGCLQVQLFFFATILMGRIGLSPFVAICLVYAPAEAAAGLGPVLLRTCEHAISASLIDWGQLSLIIILVLLFMVLATLGLFLATQNRITTGASEKGAHSAERTEGSSPAFSTEKLQEMWAQYGLTPREQEVATLLFQGRNLPFIQERLSISKGTAHTHLMHIYQKMNVHNRQEFLDLLHE